MEEMSRIRTVDKCRRSLRRGTPVVATEATFDLCLPLLLAASSIDVAAVEEHLVRYAVSCPLCRAVDHMGVAQHVCGIDAHDDADDSISVVIVVCKRCGYLMPLALDRYSASTALAA